ncbi:protein ABIL1 isoform X2 [Amborella trichopoda]|nr:protein ABIL1 isoform X2 [Amborella trichopoda]|eukprot:XP_020521841.1 protein ABIL1 isoform X2 [Amborella trichopoda]
MVLDNLKDYAVRALVNAVDHLGTVAYKLTDLFEQQTVDASSVELKISCLNQHLQTCQAYTDKEGLKQQQLFTVIPRHHKHYVLPKLDTVNKKSQSNGQIRREAGQKDVQAKPFPLGTSASKTLSWHLASNSKATPEGDLYTSTTSVRDSTSSATASGVFYLPDEVATSSMPPSAARIEPSNRAADSGVALHALGITRRDAAENAKSLSQYRSFDNVGRREISRPPVRSKSMLSALFTKHKSAKIKLGHPA